MRSIVLWDIALAISLYIVAIVISIIHAIKKDSGEVDCGEAS